MRIGFGLIDLFALYDLSRMFNYALHVMEITSAPIRQLESGAVQSTAAAKKTLRYVRVCPRIARERDPAFCKWYLVT